MRFVDRQILSVRCQPPTLLDADGVAKDAQQRVPDGLLLP